MMTNKDNTLVLDDEMTHICDEIGIKRHSKNALIHAGITSFGALLDAKDVIVTPGIDSSNTCLVDNSSSKNGLPIKDECRSKLLNVIEWYTLYMQENAGQKPDIIQDFSDQVLDEYIKDVEAKSRFIVQYVESVLGSSPSELNELYVQDMITAGCNLEKVIDYCIEKVMTPQLVEKCGNFDYRYFLKGCVEHFHSRVISSSNVADERCTFLVSGKTQSGKSSVKGVLQSFCAILKVPLIIITKGVSESKELHKKMQKLAEHTSTVDPSHVLVKAERRIDEINQVFMNGSTSGRTLIVADTEKQVKVAIRAIQRLRDNDAGTKFVLAVDECDAMDRTFDKSQKFEIAYEELLDLNPCLVVKVSATIIPTVLLLMEKRENFKFFNLTEFEEYYGLDQIKPFVMNGEEVYVDRSELNVKTLINGIPYANNNVIAFYDDALSGNSYKKGILLLDCSCPRVKAEHNVYDKANAVQQMYKHQGKDIIVVAVTGSRTQVKIPQHKEWEPKCGLISKVIEDIDDEFGLEMPIFIFGFSKMRRGVSFRSSKRVPTHFLVALGRGHHCSSVVQTLGRATFNGKTVLEENGFNHVTILTNAHDFTMALTMQTWVKQIFARIENGWDPVDAVTTVMPDEANFLRHTFRELGHLKGQRQTCLDIMKFENVYDLREDDKITIKHLQNDEVAQKMLRTILNLVSDHEEFNEDDLCDAYDDIYQSLLTIKECREKMRYFRDNALVNKLSNDGFYTADSCYLTELLNHSLSRTTGERFKNCVSEEVSNCFVFLTF
jgi:hypothetical protein